MSLADVKHQGRALSLIQRAMTRERVPHAYIFHGPDGVGKELAAFELARVLLCGDTSDVALSDEVATTVGVETLRAACAKCEDCAAVGAGAHPDLHIIYRQLNRDHPEPEVRKRKALDIGVDVLRHFVIEKVGLTPNRGRAKVFVIREADRITPQAQNALLKTLEEPPDKTVLILLVRSVDRLLPTTLSRCQVVGFDVLPGAFVKGKLAEAMPSLSASCLDWYSACADGSAGRAIEMAGDELFEVNGRIVDGLAELAGGDPAGLVKAWTEESKALGERYRKRDPEITDTEATRRGFKSVFHLAATWYADVLRCGAGGKPPVAPGEPSGVSGGSVALVNADRRDGVARAAETIDAELAASAIGRLARTEYELDRNVYVQLCIETLANDLAHINAGEALAMR